MKNIARLKLLEEKIDMEKVKMSKLFDATQKMEGENELVFGLRRMALSGSGESEIHKIRERIGRLLGRQDMVDELIRDHQILASGIGE